MKHETEIATLENVVTAFCFGVGALLVVLALYTLAAVKTVNAENTSEYRLTDRPITPISDVQSGLLPENCCGTGVVGITRFPANG